MVGRENGRSQVITGQSRGKRPHKSTLLTTNSNPFREPTLTCHCYQKQGWLWYMYYKSYEVYKGHLNFKMLYQVMPTSCLHAGIWSGLSFPQDCSCFQSICTNVLLCPETSISLFSFAVSGFHSLSDIFIMSVSLGRRGCDTDVLFKAQHSAISSSLHLAIFRLLC